MNTDILERIALESLMTDQDDIFTFITRLSAASVISASGLNAGTITPEEYVNSMVLILAKMPKELVKVTGDAVVAMYSKLNND